ncbi:MAG: ribonuclease P protein component [Gordonia sp. (in: high G+C Gram-positive bacteria)]|uniref:ribonuclease P protein component n=1 Tax=Gordonia sp. (in: high G+C Gram-positive bacteria) TaxID=84139 RepID=UPI0039E67A0D
MSADSTRISRSADFARTLDKGVRVSAHDVVIHIAPVPQDFPDSTGIREDVSLHGGPWLGLIVSKKVGNAVVRHRVARRLRHAFAASKDALPTPESYVVLRARPSAAGCSSADLAEQLRRGFGRGKRA